MVLQIEKTKIKCESIHTVDNTVFVRDAVNGGDAFALGVEIDILEGTRNFSMTFKKGKPLNYQVLPDLFFDL
jgi:hypothetical protein